MQIHSVGLILAFGYFSSFGNGFLDYRCLKEWEGKASTKGNFPSLVSNASDYWRGVWTEQIRRSSENFVPFARITGNRIWRVISQRRSTWLEVFGFVNSLSWSDVLLSSECWLHLDLNMVCTVSSHLLCSFRRQRLSSDQIMVVKLRRVEFDPLWLSGITMRSARIQ